MLASAYRLRGVRNLERVRRSKHVIRGPRLILRLVQRSDAGPPRIAIAVGRRVSRRAVDRNQVTRWLREGVRTVVPLLHGGVDLYFSATAATNTYSFATCQGDVRSLLERARLLFRTPPSP